MLFDVTDNMIVFICVETCLVFISDTIKYFWDLFNITDYVILCICV